VCVCVCMHDWFLHIKPRCCISTIQYNASKQTAFSFKGLHPRLLDHGLCPLTPLQAQPGPHNIPPNTCYSCTPNRWCLDKRSTNNNMVFCFNFNDTNVGRSYKILLYDLDKTSNHTCISHQTQWECGAYLPHKLASVHSLMFIFIASDCQQYNNASLR